MKKAIITGANGLVGSAVISKLLENGVDVLAITRSTELNKINRENTNGNLTHVCLDLNDISKLPQIIGDLNWEVRDECVFYHFAWSGYKRLMDGSIEDQMKNVGFTANAVKIASSLGVAKFINSGTIEESIAENFLKESWVNNHYGSNNGNYAIAKIAARNMAKLVSYLNKIDYIHTRFSAVIDSKLTANGYLSVTFRSILNGSSFEKPLNNGLFDIIDIDDLATSFYKIGMNGKNKKDYFIGSGNPNTLEEYFNAFQKWHNTGEYTIPKKLTIGHNFNTEFLNNELGIDLSDSFNNVLKKISK